MSEFCSVTRIRDFMTQSVDVNGHAVNLVTYGLGDRFVCKVENSDVGLTVATITRPTLQEAVEAGLREAQSLFVSPSTELPNQGEMPRTLSRVIAQLKDGVVEFTPFEFLSLTMKERMSHILSGRVTFQDTLGATISSGEAVELLRSFILERGTHPRTRSTDRNATRAR